ncbi:MAG: RDD family protein [Syntrophobacterales bacterium]|nr:MAG: RDD family protein [Syntrophobacterales bacterium]
MHRHYGGFWRRSLAFFIDIFILYILSNTLFFAWIFITDTPGESHDFFILSHTTSEILKEVVLPYYGISTLLNMTYFTYFHGTIGQTPGKKLLGLKVIEIDGKDMTFGVAFLRWVGYIISKLALFLGFIWIAFDGRKQGWHDKIAGTYVIRVNH